jgi:hypothetical protein
MPTVTTGVRADSLVLQATYFGGSGVHEEDLGEEEEVARFPSRSWATTGPWAAGEVGGPGEVSLRDAALALTGLSEYLVRADQLAEVAPSPQAMHHANWYLLRRANWAATDPPYKLISIEMRSPLAVVIEVPAEVSIAMLFGMVYLAERLFRSKTVISRNKAKDLRDKAVYDRQRELIMQGKADAFAFDLRRYPVPDRLALYGGDEDPSEADMQKPQLPRPSDDE